MNCLHPHVVVTGASSGIGRATATRLADAGWHAYAEVCRPDDGDSLLERDAAGNEVPDTGTDLYRDSYLGMIEAALARVRHASPAALYSAGKETQLMVTLARYVPTSILDSLHRKAFGPPAPGSRATAGVVRGATR
jgi:NAD(P)-dependent dehydrogenase (short-subunit alcohol dehydrogenase family)